MTDNQEQYNLFSGDGSRRLSHVEAEVSGLKRGFDDLVGTVGTLASEFKDFMSKYNERSRFQLAPLFAGISMSIAIVSLVGALVITPLYASDTRINMVIAQAAASRAELEAELARVTASHEVRTESILERIADLREELAYRTENRFTRLEHETYSNSMEHRLRSLEDSVRELTNDAE